MFGLGGFELVVIVIVLLLVLGPDRLPPFMKAAGKVVRQFKQASRDLRETSGIDDLMREEPPPPPPPEPLTLDAILREQPPEGPDLAGVVLAEGDAVDPSGANAAEREPATVDSPSGSDA